MYYFFDNKTIQLQSRNFVLSLHVVNLIYKNYRKIKLNKV